MNISKKQNNNKTLKFIENFLVYALLVIIAAVIILPILWIILSSLQKGTSLYS